MAHKFHKLKTESDFPYLDNQNVYQFDNQFDYQRYDYTQMKITLCTVPWDMGEAHIGARTISGIGNVVYFGSAENRDAWFNAIPDSECYRFETKYKELHRNQTIDVPIPFDVAAKYNYIVVEYSLFANDGSPVMYEHDGGVRKWFWFIREVEFVAPNNTRLHILDDAFQTWIYDVHISGMILERGHAPMFATKADRYLANPLENNTYLLTEDVNFGQIEQVQHIDALALNAGDMYACIATTANPLTSWGTKAGNNWHTPASAYYFNDGVPSVFVFAVDVADLDNLLANITSSYPQFKQTVQGVFFASADLLTLGAEFEFADVSCYRVGASRKTFDLCELNKSLFGYDAKYRDIAKLYTSPYAHIEITDENGNVDVVRIEDTTGDINVSVALSIAYPFINIESHLLGVGGNASASVTYRNVSSKSFPVSGQWYETLRSWKVPTFAVVLDAAREYDYSTHFDRAQRVVDYTTAYDNASASALTEKTNADASADTAKANADASADTAKTNADASADTAKTNADASADTEVTNAGLNVATNIAITTKSNELGNTLRFQNVSNNNDTRDANADLTDQAATATIDAANQTAALSATAGGVSAVAGAITSAASGNPAGAVASVVNGLVGAGTTLASNAIGVALTATQAAITKDQAQVSTNATNNMVNANFAMQKDMTEYTDGNVSGKHNLFISGVAANNAATQKNNALNDKTTQKANALNIQTTQKANALNDQTTQKANNKHTYDTAIANAGRSRAQAQSAITNDIAQAALRSPFVYGSFADGDNATTKPMALFANIVTQSKSAIASAGDEFLRYGYALDKQWDFNGNWNIGKYFTYWKLRDFWVTNLNVPDMYMDKLRFFLYGGVTIWRKPEDIGKVSVYDNFN